MQIGMTPLYVAAQEGHTEVVRLLVEAGASKEVALTVSGLPAEAEARARGESALVYCSVS